MENQKVTQGIVVSQSEFRAHQGVEKIALFGSDGTPLTIITAAETGADVELTGYSGPSDDDPVAATDTVNEAVAKLEAQILALLARIEDIEEGLEGPG